MLTLKFFDALTNTRSLPSFNDRDLQNWARIEYRADADFAYHYFKEHNSAPEMLNMSAVLK